MKEMINYPKNFSRFYDILYEPHRKYLDHSFFLDEIKKVKGKVLEAGVGTGRFYMDALKQGADIYGLDVSEFMLDELFDKLDRTEYFRLSRQSIVDFHYDFSFDLVLAPFRVMMHVIEKDDQLRALNNVFDHLNPGGKFIFDAFVPDLEQLLHGVKDQVDFEGEYAPGRKLKRTVSTRPELIDQLIMVNFIIEWEDEEGMKKEDWTTPMRFYFRYELEHLVERSKFGINYTILGGFSGNELGKDSKEFVVVCIK